MKKNLSKILFIIGFLIFIFPFALRFISYINKTSVVYNYKSNISSMPIEEKEKKQEESDSFNKDLSDTDPIVSIEDINNSNVSSSFDFLNTGTVIGTLSIPKINVELPIYEGIEEDNLQKGVALLKDTSYPTAKENTHSVIAGHSGLTRAKILDDLDKIVIGDNFFIEYLGTTSCYKVVDIKVILPNETDSLKIQNDKTLVTLVTCTPKNINTHRLLVTGELTQMQDKVEISTLDKIKSFILENIIFIIAIFFVIIILFVYIINRIKRIKNEKNNTNGDKNGK